MTQHKVPHISPLHATSGMPTMVPGQTPNLRLPPASPLGRIRPQVTARAVVGLFGLVLVLTLLAAQPATAATLWLGWTASPSSGVAGYRVYWGSASGVYTSSKKVGLATQTQLTDLADGQRLYIALSAYDATGRESAKTPEITATPGTSDYDGDGLNESQEADYGCSSLLADSDGDGLDDGDEVDYWGSAWQADDDGDGIINLLDFDSDGDGVSDGYEVANGTDPSSSRSKPAAAMAVNAGGTRVSDSTGLIFTADGDYSGGTATTGTAPSGAGSDALLYQSQRQGSFTYSVPMVRGYYTLTLYFSDPSKLAVGKRIFDVFAEGHLVVDNLDIASQAGSSGLVKKTIPVTVRDGHFTLTLRPVVGQAVLCAFKLVPAATGPAWGLSQPAIDLLLAGN